MRLFKLLRRLSLIWYDIFFVIFFFFFLSNFITWNCAKEFSGNARIQIRIGVVNILKFTNFVKCKHLSWSMNYELRIWNTWQLRNMVSSYIQCVSISVREVKVIFLSFLMSFGKFCSFMLWSLEFVSTHLFAGYIIPRCNSSCCQNNGLQVWCLFFFGRRITFLSLFPHFFLLVEKDLILFFYICTPMSFQLMIVLNQNNEN